MTVARVPGGFVEVTGETVQCASCGAEWPDHQAARVLGGPRHGERVCPYWATCPHVAEELPLRGESRRATLAERSAPGERCGLAGPNSLHPARDDATGSHRLPVTG